MVSFRPDGGSPRRHHLDAIRVSAILLLIPYHAARYIQKGLGENRAVDAAVWFVHTWHMPLFFAISGFLAASALRRSTAARHVRSRLRRLGVPLIIGMLTVVPLANLFVIEAAAVWPRTQKIPGKRELTFGHVFNLTPQHLWFIAYLLVISLIAIGVWLALQRYPKVGATINRGFRALMRSWWGIPALASFSALILITKSGWVAGGTMSDSLVPVPTLLAYFSLFFVFGWLLSGQDELLEVLKRGAWPRFAVGLSIALPAFYAFYDNADFTGNVGTAGVLAEKGQLRLLGLLAVGLVCWLMLFGVWGLLARYVHRESRVLRYLAAASFWIYLVHIPFLVALQSSLAQTHLEVVLRYALTVTGTLALAIGSYALVRAGRRLWIRAVRRPRATRLRTAPAQTAILALTVAFALQLAAPAGARSSASPPSGPPPQLLMIHGGSFLFEDPLFEARTEAPAIAGGFVPHYLSYPTGDLAGAVLAARKEAARLRARFGHDDVYAYGSSAGGTLAALLAGDGLVSAAVAKAPTSDLLAWEWPLRTYGPDYHEQIGADPAMLRRLSPLRRRMRGSLLVVQGRADRVVPADMNRAFAAKFRRVRLWVVPGGHGTDRTRPWVTRRAIRWLTRAAARGAAAEPR
jgi:peptidoglycan/LPS O-acetylase OafA/YrhL/dienelactone hydrolase